MTQKAQQEGPRGPGQRKLFHDRGGHIDLSRMAEQLIPSVAIGAIVIFANSQVTQYQVSDLRTDVASIKRESVTQGQINALQTDVNSIHSELRTTGNSISNQNNEIVRLQSSMTAYLGQQTQLNAAMDARLTYLERADRANRR